MLREIEEDEPPPSTSSIDDFLPEEAEERSAAGYELPIIRDYLGELIFEQLVENKLVERPGEKLEEGLKIVREGGDKSREVFQEFLAWVGGYARIAKGNNYLH